jgi:hypothetical protein
MRRLLALTALSAALATTAAPAQAQCMAMYACDAVELAHHVLDQLP